MKSKFIIITITFCNVLAFSQSDYYYSSGKKIPLQKNPDIVSVIYPKGKISKALQSMYITTNDIETVFDALYDIKVLYLKNGEGYEAIKTDLRTNVSNDLIVLPSYKSSRTDLIMTNYLNVRLKTEQDLEILYSITKLYNLEIMDYSDLMPLWYTLSITSETKGTTLEVANAIFETGLFASSYPSFSYDGRECITDPDFSLQWGLQNNTYPNIDISVCAAWEHSTGQGVNIAIVDQGIEKTHSDLTVNIHTLSYDTETNTSPSQLYDNHGTHCAGIAAAAVNGNLIAGVAPDTKLMAVSNTLKFGGNYERNLARGISWAWKNGADIISCSWWSEESDDIKEAIDSALIYGRNGKGAVFVKSAGNRGGGPVSFPGDYRSEILTVSSITNDGNIASSSSIGNPVDVCAPGDGIYSTLLGNTVGYMSGTSMACPHISGVAALILQLDPSLTGQEVRDIIEQTAKKVGTVGYGNNSDRSNGTWNPQYGYGLIDAYEALRAVCPAEIFANQIVNSNTIITAECPIKIHNITVQNNAKLTLDSAKETSIYNSFEVKLGSVLEIK